jgi:hypothetical protein
MERALVLHSPKFLFTRGKCNVSISTMSDYIASKYRIINERYNLNNVRKEAVVA